MTYPRCFLLTLGILFSGLSGAGCWSISRAEEPAPEWLPWILAVCGVMGLWSLATGLFGSKKDAEALSDQSSSAHEGILIVLILAAPLYFVLKWIEARKR